MRLDDYYGLLASSAITTVVLVVRLSSHKHYDTEARWFLKNLVEKAEIVNDYSKATLSDRLHIPLELLQRNFAKSLD
ncbi:hypothetical protein FWD20_00830 [Candidatus Saccharibacteria bacterium]|nr:hypothetical protein [Candidatus Saccharibacteria bacterium]